MLCNRFMLILLGFLGLQATLASTSPNYQLLHASEPNSAALTIHRDRNCDSRPVEWTVSARIATGDSLTICFTPTYSAYIYIISESAEGTFMAYPLSSDQLGPVDSRQTLTLTSLENPARRLSSFS